MGGGGHAVEPSRRASHLRARPCPPRCDIRSPPPPMSSSVLHPCIHINEPNKLVLNVT